MADRSIVLARPAGATQLVLLFHGVGASAVDLAPVGEAIARAHPEAVVVSVEAPFASTLGQGREWFSVVGITEQTRPQRIGEVMPQFLETVAHWQQASGLGAAATTLVGFSQGAILSLEATQVAGAGQAGSVPFARVVAIAGRFAEPVRRVPAGLQVHLIHGDQDTVVPTRCSIVAAHALQVLGGAVTLDIVRGLGHGIDARVLQLLLAHLAAASALDRLRLEPQA